MPTAPRRPFHHGNLRRALIDSALRLVRAGGPDAFTVSEAAREAGVSSGAPYRHFPDRRALLRAVAAEGQEQLAERLQAAVADAGTDGWSVFSALGDAEVTFAAEQPAYFRVMNAPEYRDAEDEGLRAEVEANRARLLAAPRSREAAAAFAAQCAIYGLARMVVDGHLGAVDPEQARAAARAMIGALRGR